MLDVQSLTDGPIGAEELARRGLDDRMATIVQTLIGDGLDVPEALAPVTATEMAALGYGAPCPCGERGLRPGEALTEHDGEPCCAECAAAHKPAKTGDAAAA